MPDQGDPVRGVEERFAAAVEPGRPSGAPADADLARDLEIAAMLRALRPALSADADAKARVRARVMAALAADASPDSDPRGGPADPATPRLAASDSAPTEHLPVVPPAEGQPGTPADAPGGVASADPTTAMPSGVTAEAATTAGPSTSVLAEPDPVKALRPRRRRRHALPSRPSGRPGAPSARSRILFVGAAALLAVVAVAGGGIFASRDAVPGDALYGIKRAAEAAGGIFAAGDARGQRDLDLAVTRLDEIERMARSGAADPVLLQTAFQDFDAATSAGSRLVLTGADADHSAADLAAWSTQQTARLSALRGALPASAQPNADDSLYLLDRVHRRAVALAARASCPDPASGTVDDIGPMPATGPCGTARSTTGAASSEPSATDPAARTAPGSSSAQEPGAATPPQQDGGTDPGLVPGVSVGTSGDDGTSQAPTTTPAPPSGKNVDVPLPLPVPITVPPLVPGRPGVTLG